jgi:hypothetical protein
MTRTDLIAALESASGPSRELDAEIASYVLPVGYGMYLTREQWAAAVAAENWNSPRYTGSLDAAMTLKPEVWMVRVLAQNDGGGWFCELVSRWPSSYTKKVRSGGDNSNLTPALALCTACIKALESGE